MSNGVVDEKYIALTRELSLLQSAIAASLTKPVQNAYPLKEGIFVLDSPPNIPADEYRQVFRRILDFLLERQEQNHEELKSFYSVVGGSCSGCLEPLIHAALEVNTGYFIKLAKIRQENANLLHFVAEAAIRPFLRNLASQVTKEGAPILEQNLCPVCGEEARLAKISGDGQRTIACPRCSFEWPVREQVCLQCNNENQENQRYIQVGEQQPALLHVCDNCKGYIKEVDTHSEQLAREENAVLDLRTLHLDLLAQEKGYGPQKQQH